MIFHCNVFYHLRMPRRRVSRDKRFTTQVLGVLAGKMGKFQKTFEKLPTLPKEEEENHEETKDINYSGLKNKLNSSRKRAKGTRTPQINSSFLKINQSNHSRNNMTHIETRMSMLYNILDISQGISPLVLSPRDKPASKKRVPYASESRRDIDFVLPHMGSFRSKITISEKVDNQQSTVIKQPPHHITSRISPKMKLKYSISATRGQGSYR